MTKGYLDEIREQPAMLARLARGLPAEILTGLQSVVADLKSDKFDRVLITAMGGSLHGAYPFYIELSQKLAIPVLLHDAAELTQQMLQAVTARTLLVVISQSGESGEIVELIRLLSVRPARVISVTNMTGNSLAKWADIPLLSGAGPELAVSTKSYNGGLACLHLLAAVLTGRSQREAGGELMAASVACSEVIADWEGPLIDACGHLDPDTPIAYVGRGPSYGSAQIAALITQEASKLSCFALTGGQFRHGPIELARDGFQMVLFLGDPKTRPIDLALIDKILPTGGQVLVIAPAAYAPAEAEGLAVFKYPDVPLSLNPVLEALFVQLMQIPLATHRGFRVGEFLNATKITGIK